MQQLKQIRQSGIRFLLRQNVSISFLHCFKEKGSHLLSLKVKVIAMVENEDNLFLVEALESYKDEINQGDTISVATDSTEVSDILETYQEHNNFRIYFPKIDDTSDGISVTCLDVVQYDSSGEIIQQAERQ